MLRRVGFAIWRTGMNLRMVGRSVGIGGVMEGKQ